MYKPHAPHFPSQSLVESHPLPIGICTASVVCSVVVIVPDCVEPIVVVDIFVVPIVIVNVVLLGFY